MKRWIAMGMVAFLSATSLRAEGLAAGAPEYPRVSSFTPPDLSWVPRKLAKEPAYASAKVRYCIFSLGDGRNSVMTLAWDESEGTGKGYDTLYADTNLNGTLGEEGERFFWSNDAAQRPEEKDRHERYLVNNVKEKDSDRSYSFRFAAVYRPDVLEYDSVYRMSSPGLSYEVGPLPGELKLLWGDSLAAAPVYRFGGEPIPEVNGKPAGGSLGTWKAGGSASASIFLALRGAPEGAQLRFYGAKFPSLAAAVRDNRWGKAGYPIVLLRVLEPATRQQREIIPFGDSCPCAGGFAPALIVPSRVPSGTHEVVVRMLRVPELGGCADFVWPVTIENPFEKNRPADPALDALKKQFPGARLATLRRADTAAERAAMNDGETVIPAAAVDTTMLPTSRDWDARHANTGADPQLWVGARPHNHADNRSLLRFDLSGIPAGTEILGARLRLALVNPESAKPIYGDGDTLEAYALRRPWNERADNPDGWACWFGPRYRGKLRESWAKEGADGEGTDRDAAPAAVTTGMRGYPGGPAEIIRFVDLDLTGLVKAWLAGEARPESAGETPATTKPGSSISVGAGVPPAHPSPAVASGARPNFGVLLRMRGKGGGWIASSEQGDYPLRPALVLAYRGADPEPTYTPRPGEDLAAALAEAGKDGRPLAIRFYLPDCAVCRKIEETTFKDPRVIQSLEDMLVVKVDASRSMKKATELGVEGVPAIVVVEADGRTVKARITAQEMIRAETLLPKLAVARPPRPKAALPRAHGTVTVDGDPVEPAWKTAGVAASFLREDGQGPSAAATRVLALAGGDALYVAGLCPEPNPAGMVAKADALDGDQVWQDDCLEVFVEPVKGSGEERHFIVSASGARYDSRNGDKAWNGEWTAAVKRGADGWNLEMRIPWSTLGLAGAPKAGAEMGFNAGRVRNADGEASQWSLTGGSSHQPAKFGTLEAE